MSLEVAGFAVMCALNIGAICYGYGTLNNKVKNTESDFRDIHKSVTELFSRMNVLEVLAGRLEDAAERWEKIMSNGINAKIQDLLVRMERMEQHCKDIHADNLRAEIYGKENH
jgi:Mn-dependent DtxR family transcriptional regulator